jgi:hypothetical protein
VEVSHFTKKKGILGSIVSRIEKKKKEVFNL